MKEKYLKNVHQKFYYHKLDNGLEVYLLPNDKVKNIYATFTTKYGSVHDEFVPINENKMLSVPKGIAHFLEHKMFEQKDGIDPFTFYSKSGTDSNAHTTLNHTTYEFTGPNNFVENINYLLDFVQELYLTDENVEAEKGIIEQELKMYLDDPNFVLYDGIRNNSFVKSSYKYPIGGTIKSIYDINKDYLEKCYYTFYNPANMFVVITGNFDPEIAIDVIEKNQGNKNFKKLENIKNKEFKEPDKVNKVYEEVEKNVDNNKFAYALKMNLNKFSNFEAKKMNLYLSIIFNTLFGVTSEFYEKMNEKNYLTSPLDIDKIITDTHLLLIISGESLFPKELFAQIESQLKNIEVSLEDFDMEKKVILSSNIRIYDNIIGLNDKVVSDVIKYNKFYDNDYEIVKSLNLEELRKLIKKLDISNKSIFLVRPFENKDDN